MQANKILSCGCSKRSRALWAIPAVAVSLLAFYGWATRSAMESPANGTSGPAWSLRDIDGKTVRSSDFKGKVVLLDFWATWCSPCRAEIPGFVELQKQYGKAGLAVIGVSVDGAAHVDAVKRFAERLDVNYPILLATDEIVSAFGGIEGLPTTFIINQEGRIVSQHLGFSDKEELENEIKPLLRGQRN